MDNIDLYIEMLSEAHCVMVDIPKHEKLMEFINKISHECIYEESGENYGKETSPHVTVMYGIAPIEEQKTKKLLSQIPNKIVAELGKISKFDTDDRYDVLKIEVVSPHLTKIHEMLKRTCENNYKWPQYQPHVTLAYVKKGSCNELVGNCEFAGTKIMFETFLYSNGNREENNHVPMKEYNVGTSGGYGGGAMAGGAVAPMNWAGTNSSPQTSRRLKDYPASRRYTYVNGNTVVGNAPYDTITKDDLVHPKFGSNEIMAGMRSEMHQMEYPDKDFAREVVIKNLEKNPKFYSDLDKYLKSDTLEETNMNQINQKQLARGIEVEREHNTDDDRLPRKIALDHLGEDPDYYTKLDNAGLEEADIVVIGNTPAMSQQVQSAQQAPLASSGLGKSGAPKPLTSPRTDAPETKLIRGNTIATTKTQPLNPNKESDPINHFCGQIAGAISSQQMEETTEEDPNPPKDPTVNQMLDKVRAVKAGKHFIGHGHAGNKPAGPDTPRNTPGRPSWNNMSPKEKIYASDRKREREESPENMAIAASEKSAMSNIKPSTTAKATSLRDKFLKYRGSKSAQ